MNDAIRANVKVARQNIQAARNRLNDALETKGAYDNLCEAEALLEAAVSLIASARYSVSLDLATPEAAK